MDMIEIQLYEEGIDGKKFEFVKKMVLKGIPRKDEQIYVHRKGHDEPIIVYTVVQVAYIEQPSKCLVFADAALYCTEEWGEFMKGIIYGG